MLSKTPKGWTSPSSFTQDPKVLPNGYPLVHPIERFHSRKSLIQVLPFSWWNVNLTILFVDLKVHRWVFNQNKHWLITECVSSIIIGYVGFGLFLFFLHLIFIKIFLWVASDRCFRVKETEINTGKVTHSHLERSWDYDELIKSVAETAHHRPHGK